LSIDSKFKIFCPNFSSRFYLSHKLCSTLYPLLNQQTHEQIKIEHRHRKTRHLQLLDGKIALRTRRKARHLETAEWESFIAHFSKSIVYAKRILLLCDDVRSSHWTEFNFSHMFSVSLFQFKKRVQRMFCVNATNNFFMIF
jgi:hypothetical protein